MSCGLAEETLFILKRLHTSRNFSSDKGFHSEKLKNLYNKKYPGRGYLSFDNSIKKLLNDGYITRIRKSEIKYFISDPTKAISALIEHEVITPDGLTR